MHTHTHLLKVSQQVVGQRERLHTPELLDATHAGEGVVAEEDLAGGLVSGRQLIEPTYARK
jgi:hypothetical protein